MCSNKKFISGLVLMIAFISISVVGYATTPYNFAQQISGKENFSPSSSHPMGTDALGRDMSARIFVGVGISICIAISAVLINFIIGVFFGSLAGYIGGLADTFIMRSADIVASIPEILYLIVIMVFLKDVADSKNIFISVINQSHGLIGIIITLCIAFWIPLARILRNQILSLKESEFIMAARIYGASDFRIIVKYIFPNCLPLILVTTISRIPTAIFFEAFLSFIGLGMESPFPSLGVLMSDGLSSMRSAPYLLFFPSVSIILIIYAFNLLGDGLRDILDDKIITQKINYNI